MFKNKKIVRLYAFPWIFLVLCICGIHYFLKRYFPEVTIHQIIFFLNSPMTGVDTQIAHKFLTKCIFMPALASLIICYLPEIRKMCTPIFKFLGKYPYTKTMSLISISLISLCLAHTLCQKRVWNFFFAKYSDFYEKNFVTPTPDNISFTHKKNLIILHVESLEKTFENKEFFGSSMLPHLEKLERQGIQFSNYQNGFATDYTQGSLIALFSGLPSTHIPSNMTNVFGKNMKILPNYYSLGKILADNGYETYSLQGTKSDFAGQKPFLQTHGISHIEDFDTIKQNYPSYEITGAWGYGDNEVLSVLKDKITKIDHKKPYFIYVATIDTHAHYLPDAHEPSKFSNKYKNIIYNTNIKIAEFINWFKTQPDYKNTVIVIIGDHLRMGDNFKMPRKRAIYNLFLNAPRPETTNRYFTQIDLFPSILEAIGGKIPNHHLGLGVSVFSKEKTLAECYTTKELEEHLEKKNKLYESLWQ